MTQGPLTSLPIQHTLALCGFQNQGPSRGWREAQNPHLTVSRPKLVAREVSPLKVLKKIEKKSLEGLHQPLPAILSAGGRMVMFLFFLIMSYIFLIFCNVQM